MIKLSNIKYMKMLSILAILVGISLFFVTDFVTADEGEGLTKKLLPGVTNINKHTKILSKESIDKIAKAVGESVSADNGLTIYEVTTPKGNNGLITFTKVNAGDKDVTLGIAIIPPTQKDKVVSILSVRAFDGSGNEISDYRAFFSQFTVNESTFIYSPIGLLIPIDKLKETIKKATEDKDKGAKETIAVLKADNYMRMVSALWNLTNRGLRGDGKSIVGFANELTVVYDGLGKTSSEATFLDSTQMNEFKKFASTAKGDVERIVKLVNGGDIASAKDIAKNMRNNCDRCHNAFERTFSKKGREYRIAYGSYFYVGYDVIPVKGLSSDVMQNLATAIRKNVLIMLEAK